MTPLSHIDPNLLQVAYRLAMVVFATYAATHWSGWCGLLFIIVAKDMIFSVVRHPARPRTEAPKA